MTKLILMIMLAVMGGLLAGCQKNGTEAQQARAPHKHEHVPPHHGTPVVLGNEEYHVELVLDTPAGKLQAYVMDGELENFIRIPAESFTINATVGGVSQPLVLHAVANTATGEKVGDSSLFETQADWLKVTSSFDAVIDELIVRSNRYQHVSFNFPKGNDTDAPEK